MTDCGLVSLAGQGHLVIIFCHSTKLAFGVPMVSNCADCQSLTRRSNVKEHFFIFQTRLKMYFRLPKLESFFQYE